jgi:signal transduction histidine kinase
MKKVKLKKTFEIFKKHFKLFENKVQKKELQKAYNELQTSYTSLKNYKELLEQRVQEEVSKRQIQEKILARQTRLAAMGEMMDAVAHQWSQPLSIIDMNVNLIPDDFKRNLVNEQYINETVNSINLQTKHLQSTLNKFRHFFHPIDKNELLDLNIMVKETLLLLHDEILKHHIDINFSYKEKCIVYGSINEIQHVIINLINNAKDSFNIKNLKNRSIDIYIKNTTLYFALVVEENAGGIDKKILKDIFKPYISTKDSTGGSGIGLYMSYLIMQKHNGKISAKNSENGAKFIIKFYKEQ